MTGKAGTVGKAYLDVELRMDKVLAQIAQIQSRLNSLVANVGISDATRTRASLAGGASTGSGASLAAGTIHAAGANLASGANRAAGEIRAAGASLAAGTIHAAGEIRAAGANLAAGARLSATLAKLGIKQDSRDLLFKHVKEHVKEGVTRSITPSKKLPPPLPPSGFEQAASRFTARFPQLSARLSRINGALSSAVKSWGLMTAGIFSAIAALRMVARVVGRVVGSFADLYEEINKSQVLFRDAMPVATRFAKQMAASYGLSATESLRTISDIQNALIPFLKDRKLTAGLSEELATRAIDIGSLRNLDTAEVTTLMTSALIRGGRAAQSLGSSMSDVEVRARATRIAAQRGGDAESITNKILARREIILERTADAQGDLFRTADSIANAWRGVMGTLKNVEAVIGKILDSLDIGGYLVAYRGILGFLGQIGSALAYALQPLRFLLSLLWNFLSQWAIGKQKLLEKIGSGSKKMVKELFSFTTNAAKWGEAKFYEEMAKRKQLMVQSRITGDDNSLAIAEIENRMRLYRLLVEFYGDGIELPSDPIEGLNDELGKTEKLTSKIIKNIASLIEEAQDWKQTGMPDFKNISGDMAGFKRGMYRTPAGDDAYNFSGSAIASAIDDANYMDDVRRQLDLYYSGDSPEVVELLKIQIEILREAVNSKTPLFAR